MAKRTKTWKTAELILNDKGWVRASAKVEKAVTDLGSPEDFENVQYALRVDTHPRSGEFGEMVDDAVDAVRAKAAGRKIWWINDPDGEWDDFLVLFGEEEEILAGLLTTELS